MLFPIVTWHELMLMLIHVIMHFLYLHTFTHTTCYLHIHKSMTILRCVIRPHAPPL